MTGCHICSLLELCNPLRFPKRYEPSTQQRAFASRREVDTLVKLRRDGVDELPSRVPLHQMNCAKHSVYGKCHIHEELVTGDVDDCDRKKILDFRFASVIFIGYFMHTRALITKATRMPLFTWIAAAGRVLLYLPLLSFFLLFSIRNN